MQSPIVQESALRSAHQQIVNLAAAHRGLFDVDFDDLNYGCAFVYYLFFSRHPAIGNILGVDLNDEENFYNAYYWFQRFTKLHMSKHGYDAGLEQQAFKLLEEVDFDLDFEVIAMIDNKAKE